ncbi:MAG: SurA N-terminal domain-containing protein [Coxiellaceae bacterium]|nr:SurA N-terminal domain-containing protein [Coxiellaceae bacterium]
MLNKISSIILSGLLSLTLSCGVAQAASSSPVQSVNNIAAIVNKSVITEYQVQQAINNVKKHMEAAHVAMPDDALIRKQVIQTLINEELITQMAKRAKLSISDAEVTAAIANIAKSNKLTVSQLTQKVKQQGEDFADFKSDIKKQMLTSKVQHAAVASKIHVTDSQINQAIAKYNKSQGKQQSYHIADIVVAVPDDAKDTQIANAKNRAQDIYKKLSKGGNFSKVAKLESNNEDGPSDGDLGWQTANEIPDLFLDQLEHMKINQISKPIQAGNGFHILKLLGVKKSDKKMSRDQARKMLENQQYQKAVAKWIKGIRKSAYIKVTK